MFGILLLHSFKCFVSCKVPLSGLATSSYSRNVKLFLMAQELKNLQMLVNQCGLISSNNMRCSTFQKHGQCIKSLLALIYDPYVKFGVTKASLLKRRKQNRETLPESPKSLTELLHLLGDREITGHQALDTCLSFISSFPNFEDVIIRALNKNLKIRVGIRMVNKAFPLLVSEFSCALSHPMEKHIKFFTAQRENWFISRKLDGCRCMFVCENGVVTAYSRSGHVYPAHIQGLEYFQQKFSKLTGVLDGEMGVVDVSGKEYFNIANSIMNPNATKVRSKKNLQMPVGCHLCFFVFDLIPLNTFKSGFGGPAWSVRQKQLKSEVSVDDKIRILEQHPIEDEKRMWTMAATNGWEGLMYRLDGPYEGKKSRRMLKRKIQTEDEYVIVFAEASTQMIPGSSNSHVALEHVAIEHKGSKVFVGSGWSWEERVKYGLNPSQLVGMHCTVKHYGETKNSHGTYSLRHPSIKVMWSKKGRTH